MPSKKKSASKPAAAGAFPNPIAASTRSTSNSIQNPTALPSVDKSTPTYPEPDSRTGDTTESAGEPTSLPAVNRKKQKRRQKEAAKRLAENQSPQLSNGHIDPKFLDNQHMSAVKQGRGPVKGYFTEEPDYIDPDYQDPLDDQDDAFYSNDEDPDYIQDYASGPDHSWLNTSKRKKTPQKRTTANSNNSAPRSNFPTLSNAALRSAHKMSSSNDNIWNTSTQAERENIKQFWLELGEDERRSLVRVEKEAVLRKMKEQQKHSCSCSVCGRKRTAIEEELEVLYDAYYQELEQFANHNNDLSDTSQAVTPSRTAEPYSNQTHPMAGAYPVQRRIQEIDEHGDELDEDDDDYDDDDEDEEDQYSDEDDYDDELPTGPSDFLQFGNSLTVKDGILTVADDLLKNNGKHFIDMMEQLAERRMQREQEIYYNSRALAHQARQGHNEPPLDDDDDDYDDELDVDEDYDSQEEDDFEGDEMDSMTEEQRMEEGRRMFQIFAARMFEQRVLTAYKEKVAAERQQKLLEELDEELRMDGQREAKKAKDAAKKKEKKARQKAAKEEEKAKKDAERIAQETAAREAEEKKAAEKKARQEEQRKKREAERKAADEERLRKEAEKLQRQQKEKERQQDAEKKAKEAKEREKKQREEAKRKEREEREAKDAEARERRQKEEAERRSRQEQAQKEKPSAPKLDKDLKKGLDTANRPQPVALPPGLNPPSRNSQVQSPSFQAATPVVPPTLPTPARSQQPSQPSQPSQSHSSSPRSPRGSTEASQTSASPALPSVSQTSAPTQLGKNGRQGPPLHHPQPSAPRSPLNNLARGGQFPFNGGPVPGLGMNGVSMNGPPAMQHNLPPMPMHHGPPMTMNQRYAPNGLPYPPGFNQPRPYQPTPNMPFHPPLPNGPQVAPQQQPTAHKPPVHSRQASNSETSSQPAPIARPGPIARPLSTTPDKQRPGQQGPQTDVDRITTQLGSSALLDDSDEPFVGQLETKPSLAPVGPPGSNRVPFASNFSNDKSGSFALNNASWGGFHNGISGGNWGSAPPRTTPGWPQPMFDPMGPQPGMGRPHVPRPIAVRLMLVQACRQLTSMTGAKTDGYHPVREVLRQVEQIKPPGEPVVSMEEMLGICDTEGNVQNGGGTFDVMADSVRGQIVKFVEENSTGLRQGVGDIGSPLMAPSQHSSHQASSFGSIGQGVSHQHSYVQHAPGFGAPGRTF